VDDYLELMHALDSEPDASRRAGRVLEWVIRCVGVDGAALVDLRKKGSPPVILAAHGSLSAVFPDSLKAPSSAESLAAPTPVTIQSESGSDGSQGYWLPVAREDGEPGDGVLLHGASAAGQAELHPQALYLACRLLADLIEKNRLQEMVERQRSFISLLVDRKLIEGGDAVNPGFDLVTEGLNLPLYMSDSSGSLLYASPAFLRLVGYPSIHDVRAVPDFFTDPAARAEEMALLRARGKVLSFSLDVRSGAGRTLHIQDSAVTVGVFVFGAFFDVTDFLTANKDMRDSLEIQELLNDRIIAASQTLQRTQVTSIRALARLAEFRHQETGFHLQRMCEYARILAQEVYERQPYTFRLTTTYTNDISLSAMLHDIGKVSIPDSILLKPGSLARDEWDVMKTHTTAGWEILHRADRELGEQSFLTLASIIALSHHEKFDGTGYPSGLRGDRIPLSARISALADVYDALTTRRPYKDAWPHEKAVDEIRGLAGRHFDPVLVDIFAQVSTQFDEVRRVFPE
jgi:HD-GYP domain-containing protein (c-di-GMP phosphodiesterase class II)